MTFFEEMRDVARELLGPGEDSFGELIPIERPTDTYDKATRKAGAGIPLTQEVWGTLDSELTPVSAEGSLTSKYERILTAVPAETNGFQPGVNDRVLAEGKTWSVEETAHVIKQGVAILWICGLKSL